MIPVFDRLLIDRRRARATRAAVAGADFLLRPAVDDLLDRLSLVQRRFDTALDLGTPTSLLAERLTASGQVDCVYRLARHGGSSASALEMIGDEEALPIRAGSLDLVVSALSLQLVNDLPGTLAQLRRALRPDGLLLVSLLGGDTLSELRTAFATAESELTGGAAPRVAPFADLADLGSLLQRAGFALPVTDRDTLTARYDSMFDLMRDIRAMGATNALLERDRKPLRRSVVLRAAEIYRDRFSDADGRVRATFAVLSLSAWAPHASQQKPLAPGSARSRLADVLGSKEQSAGEKTG